MKRSNALLAVLVLIGCQSTGEGGGPVFEGEPYGEPLTLTRLTPVAEILATPQDYLGERVLVEGTVVDVCNNKGCWMDLAVGGAEIQVKVDDDVIVFPLSARGRTALVEGIVEQRDLTAEQAYAAAAHRAEEQGVTFDSTASYAATTTYRIRGLGALIRG